MDRRHRSAEPQVDVVVAVPGGGVGGELVERLLAGQVFLRQWRTLVGQVLFSGEKHDVTVEVIVAQRFSGLCSGKSTADDEEGFRFRRHDSTLRRRLGGVDGHFAVLAAGSPRR